MKELSDEEKKEIIKSFKKDIMMLWNSIIKKIYQKYTKNLSYDIQEDVLIQLYEELSKALEKIHFPNYSFIYNSLNTYTKAYIKKIQNQTSPEINFSDIKKYNYISDQKDYTEEEYVTTLTQTYQSSSIEENLIQSESIFYLDSRLSLIQEILLDLGLEEEYNLIIKIMNRTHKTNKEKYLVKALRGSIKFLLLSLGRYGWKY